MKTILIIDDSKDMRATLRRRIHESGGADAVRVVEAADGLAGIKAALREKPDLIFMDIVLPYLSGYAASVRLKNMEAVKSVPIVGMTSRVEPDTREKVLTWCDDFLAKPFDDTELMRVLNRYLKPGSARKSRPSAEQQRLRKVTGEIADQLQVRVEELTELNRKLEKQTRLIRTLYLRTKDTKRKLKRLHQARADFTDLLSHEIKTPLTAVTGYAECLRVQAEDRLTPEDVVLLDRIEAASERIALLVNEISRMNRLRFNLRVRHGSSVNDAVTAVLNRRTDAIQQKNLHVKAAIDDRWVVPLDPRYLEEMVDHLVKNAIVFTEPGGHVEIRCDGSDGTVQLVVADDGVGIDPAHLQDVLQPLVQYLDVEHHRSHPLKGLGMGLTICAEMAHNVGGNLEIFSEGKGRGTRVTITLPAAEAHADHT